jgi:hypothetical protein
MATSEGLGKRKFEEISGSHDAIAGFSRDTKKNNSSESSDSDSSDGEDLEDICPDCNQGLEACEGLTVRSHYATSTEYPDSQHFLGAENAARLLKAIQEYNGLQEVFRPPPKMYRRFFYDQLAKRRDWKPVPACYKKTMKSLFPDGSREEDNLVTVIQSVIERAKKAKAEAKEAKLCQQCYEDPCTSTLIKPFIDNYFHDERVDRSHELQKQVEHRRGSKVGAMEESEDNWNTGLRNWVYYSFSTLVMNMRGKGMQYEVPECAHKKVKEVVNGGMLFPYSKFASKFRM